MNWLATGSCWKKATVPDPRDLGDVSMLMPVIQLYTGGAEGGLHSARYAITDEDTAYLLSSEFLACMTYELLKEDAFEAKKIVKDYQPVFASKDAYFQCMDNLFSDRIFPENDIIL